jgi:acyl-homoserine-lactone acylase
MLQALAQASDQLTQKFGSWRQPWGDINRVQRLTDDIDPVFSDAAPSLAVPFTSAQWGSLASITGPKTDQKKRYGNSGNSFVAAIEFGPRIKAVAVTAGGESGDPGSKHFNDEAGRYASGKLREVYFYPDQLKHHTERRYHPGE